MVDSESPLLKWVPKGQESHPETERHAGTEGCACRVEALPRHQLPESSRAHVSCCSPGTGQTQSGSLNMC